MIKSVLKLKRLFILLLFPISLILTFIAKNNTELAEWYATNIYPVFSVPINKITSVVPFSIAEFILIIVFISVILYFILYIIYIIKSKGQYAFNIIKFILNIFCALGIITFMFTISCGINYHRTKFSDKIELSVQPYSEELLIELCEDLSQKANILKEALNNDKKLSYYSFKDIAVVARESYENIDKIYPSLSYKYQTAKPVFLSKLMSYANITGFFFPFTYEANINTDAPSFTIPSTICHELAHLQGYMREDEANFISFLICNNSNDLRFQYSGVITAYIYATNALYRQNKESFSEIFNNLNDDVKKDLKNSKDYWGQFDGFIADISDKVNDTYLKANHQKDGVGSYGKMVDLLLAYYISQK